ncbi:MFS transporter [Novosphingobium piscinae]|uniref:MFS transporter n=1 Tax=Novosphingobium piscinae TaxID=1507448 RepID=A0A7X1KPL1_9SPHN|nr:MFS transporter [Novosphingobium piscinae]MBC2668834.1 MFS transporter [Novosphingobium piscinae]
MTGPAAMTERQRTLAVLVLVVALVLEIVDLTIVNIALPAISSGIGADAVHAQWIVAGYSISFALLLLAGGRLGDSYGYRRMLVWGVAGFTLASAACGLAQTGGQLVAARLLQGATGAVMAPQSLALLQVLFTPLERVSKMALFGVIGGLAAIAGPILGGVLIDANLFGLGWRLLFLINVPVGALTIAAAMRLLPPTRSGLHAGYDLGGTAWFGAAVAMLVGPLIGSEGGAGGGSALWLVLLALPLGALGWRHVARRCAAGQPALFDPAILGVRTFRLGLAMSFAFAAASAGFLLVFAFALQAERGQSPLMAGLLHMPFGFGAMFGIGFLSRKLLPRYGRVLPFLGALLMALSSWLVLAAIGLGWPLASIAPVMIAAGIGMGMTSGCIGPIAFAQMDRGHAGSASGLLKTCQQLGSAVGVALVGSAYFGWAAALHLSPTLLAAGLVAAILTVCAALALRLPRAIFAQTLTPEPVPS